MPYIIVLFLGVFFITTPASATIPSDKYKTYIHPRFKKFKAVTVPQLELFANNNIKPSTLNTRAVFYPFGGPDIIYPLLLFPQAKTYLLIGLEPCGDFKPDSPVPQNLNYQLDSLLRRSFFVTSDMSRAIPYKQGVIPLFLAQIALMDGTLTGIKSIYHSFGRSLEITFNYQQQEKKLIYVQTNVANQNLDENLIKFIKDSNLFDTCLLKASSYAFHQKAFSKLRSFVLTTAQAILQDDTGLPLKDFSPHFTIQLFGNHLRPYGTEWRAYKQNDLCQKYKTLPVHSKVPFCYGYGCGRSPVGLLLAIRDPGMNLT